MDVISLEDGVHSFWINRHHQTSLALPLTSQFLAGSARSGGGSMVMASPLFLSAGLIKFLERLAPDLVQEVFEEAYRPASACVCTCPQHLPSSRLQQISLTPTHTMI